MQCFCEITAGTNLTVMGVSMDTPFALQRIAPSLGHDVLLLSDMRNRYFDTDYGVTIVDGPLGGFLARAVFLLDATHHVQHIEMVSDVSRPPSYETILAKL